MLQNDNISVVVIMWKCLCEKGSLNQPFQRQYHKIKVSFGIGMLKSEIETPKDENSKLKQDTCEKKILIKRLMEILNKEKAKQKWQTEI